MHQIRYKILFSVRLIKKLQNFKWSGTRIMVLFHHQKGGLKSFIFFLLLQLHRMLNYEKLSDIFHLVAIAWHTNCVTLHWRIKKISAHLLTQISHVHTHACTHTHTHTYIPFCMSRLYMHWTDKSWKVSCRNRNRSSFFFLIFFFLCYNTHNLT